MVSESDSEKLLQSHEPNLMFF
jgi:hypothetical protein